MAHHRVGGLQSNLLMGLWGAASRLNEWYCIRAPLWVAVGVLNGGQTCLTPTWVVFFYRFWRALFFFSYLVLSVNEGELCAWMAGCQQTGTVDVLMREGDRGWPQSQPQAQTGVRGRTRAGWDWEAGWDLVLCADGALLCFKVRHGRETWEGKKPDWSTKGKDREIKGRLLRVEKE